MNTSAKIGGLLAAVMLAASGSAMAAEPVNPYVTSSDGKVVMDPFGLCWRTGFWTPALAEALGYNGAGCQCDKEILSKAACTAPACRCTCCRSGSCCCPGSGPGSRSGPCRCCSDQGEGDPLR